MLWEINLCKLMTYLYTEVIDHLVLPSNFDWNHASNASRYYRLINVLIRSDWQ